MCDALRYSFAGRRVTLDTDRCAHGLRRLATAARAQREQRRGDAEDRDDGRDPPGPALHAASLTFWGSIREVFLVQRKFNPD